MISSVQVYLSSCGYTYSFTGVLSLKHEVSLKLQTDSKLHVRCGLYQRSPEPAGEVIFSLPDELKDASFTTVDAEGVEWPVEKTMEGNTRTLKLNFTPEGKAPVKVIVLNVVNE